MDIKKWQAWAPWKILEKDVVTESGKGVFGREKEIIYNWRLFREDKESGGEDYKEPENLVGLAFSGGGIRSATFGLGVLEALKEKDLLKKIDYLSTVSGGGYIGSWLSANCKHTEDRRQTQKKASQTIDPKWIEKQSDWTQSIIHLRRFSNYLSPNLKFFSADTWSIFTVWIRNTLLIQLTLIFAIACCLLLSRLFYFEFFNSNPIWNAGIAAVLFVNAVFFIALNLKNMNPEWASFLRWLPRKKSGQKFIKIFAIFLLTASFCYAAVLWNQALHAEPAIDSFNSAIRYFVNKEKYFLYLSLFSFSIFSFFSTKNREQYGWKKGILIFATSIATTAVLALLLSGVLLILGHWVYQIDDGVKTGKFMAYVWAPTMVIASISIAVNMFIGMQGKDMDEYLREWWSRFGACLAVIGFSWMLVVIIAIYGPLWSFWLYYDGPWKSLTSGWMLTTLAGLFAGKSEDTGNVTQQQGTTAKIKEAGAKFAPFIFIIGLLVVVSSALHLVIAFSSSGSDSSDNGFEVSREKLLVDDSKHHSDDWRFTIDKQIWNLINNKARDSDLKLSFSTYQAIQKDFTYSSHWRLLDQAKLEAILSLCLICLICLFILGRRVDINEFSLNAFYRNRLARCFLGATRRPEERHPHPFTGFDPDDDISLASLINQNNEPSGPFHIVNCALNLGGSSDLLLHTRHSNTFTLTPLYCGSSYVMKNANSTPINEIGFAETGTYTGQGQLSLGQAIAVSGAAASPNMGYHTSTPVSFLMTLFNARLGWWFPHPLFSDCADSSPSFSLQYLIYELFGFANEKSKYLNISDGGHFENLAVYELVKRQCKVIVISDGECDPKMQFEGLANLIRLCEVDHLAKIEIDVSALKPDSKTGWSNSCCAVGKINYSAFSENKTVPPGWLIYIKAAMTGHEGTAILQYKATHSDFPHETTGDQFYAEDQFESYRNLGKNITEQLFNKWDEKHKNIIDQIRDELEQINKKPLSALSMEQIGKGLYSILSPENIHQTQSIHYADRLIEIWKQLSEDERLNGFDVNTVAVSAPIFYFCNEIIQLMENIYLDLNFEETWEREENIGWMGLFKEWANNEYVMNIWESTKHTYGIKYKSFWERKLNNR